MKKPKQTKIDEMVNFPQTNKKICVSYTLGVYFGDEPLMALMDLT